MRTARVIASATVMFASGAKTSGAWPFMKPLSTMLWTYWAYQAFAATSRKPVVGAGVTGVTAVTAA